ncbi:unnamed protein product [Owenia fusiformis]|uniref:Peroxidase n=1 Tax=Owenia fusiformis TaxID=6347 RepID=A0A8S4NQV1_OWEFU|nr:unnamed protein product [Owenia fusiformis]
MCTVKWPGVKLKLLITIGSHTGLLIKMRGWQLVALILSAACSLIVASDLEAAIKEYEQLIEKNKHFFKTGIDNHKSPHSGSHYHHQCKHQGNTVLDVEKKLHKAHFINEFLAKQGVSRAKRQATLECPFDINVPECDPDYPYRTMDGSCNNLEHPLWGSAGVPMGRLAPAEYADGLGSPRMSRLRSELPNARHISTTFHEHDSSETESQIHTHLLMTWGQILDHDLSLTPMFKGEHNTEIDCCAEESYGRPECFKIMIPDGDPRFNHECMNFVRSTPSPGIGCQGDERQQINKITSYIDGSNVYGSGEHEMRQARYGRDGKLKFTDNYPFGKPLLAKDLENEDKCVLPDGNEVVQCFKAGDERANENIGLTTMHTIWLREHNRCAENLKNVNPFWDDETLFNTARRMVGATMQHITYSEFLPIILGDQIMEAYQLKPKPAVPTFLNPDDVADDAVFHDTYDPTVNATIMNEFATAAYRFGHSLIQGSLMRMNNKLDEDHPFPSIDLGQAFFQPEELYNKDVDGIDSLIHGLVYQKVQQVDRFLSSQITDHLFENPNEAKGGHALDLAALNLQRGREHGLAGYINARQACGLGRERSFLQLRQTGDIDFDTMDKLQQIYRHVDDIDLFTGGLAENPVPGGLVGPTFACILGMQFSNLKKGDRFWYERKENGLSKAQLMQIKGRKLSKVMCDNADFMFKIQPDAFLLPTVFGNDRKPCEDIQDMQFGVFFDEQFDDIEGIMDFGALLCWMMVYQSDEEK